MFCVYFDVKFEFVGFYIYILFVLKERDLGVIFGNFVFWIYGVFVFLEENWELMV